MKPSFEETLIAVWPEAMVESADALKLGAKSYPVTKNKAKRLRQVAFVFDGVRLTGHQPRTRPR
jgi:hypothetical protein